MTVSRVTLAALAGTVAAATDTHSAAIKSFLLDMRCPTVRAGWLFLAAEEEKGGGKEGRPEACTTPESRHALYCPNREVIYEKKRACDGCGPCAGCCPRFRSDRIRVLAENDDRGSAHAGDGPLRE